MDIQGIAAAGVEAFSIDVFGTFLLRRCTGLDGVFERAFQLLPVVAATGTAEDFIRARRAAEAAARQEARAARDGSEVSIAEIYQHFPAARFGLGEGAVAALVAAEFQAERDLCFANPALTAHLQALRSEGTRVGFIADTCWGGRQLAELLHAVAPDIQWDFLFASCDYGRRKAEGLFGLALGELRVAPQAAAHLGDNDLADVISARALGMRAVFYAETDPALEAAFLQEDHLLVSRLDGGARALRRAIGTCAAGDESVPFAYGLHVLGPVMTAFDRFVAARVAELSRDSGQVAVVFADSLSRLPLDLWRAARDVPAFRESDGADLSPYSHVVAVSVEGELAVLDGAPCVALALLSDDGAVAEGFAALSPEAREAARDEASLLEYLDGPSLLGQEARLGALTFARTVPELRGFPDPFAATSAPLWTGAILARALLLPTEDERKLRNELKAAAASAATHSTAQVRMISAGEERSVSVNCVHGVYGEVQVRVPVTRSGGATALAVPASALPTRGRVRALTMQWGDSTVEAMRSSHVHRLPLAALSPVSMSLDHGRYDAGSGDGHLLIGLPTLERAVGLLTLTVSPLH